MSVQEPASAVPITTTYRETESAPSAPSTAEITMTAVGGSPPMTRQTTWSANVANPAPISPTPMKYAAIINPAPNNPPTAAASTSAQGLLVPMTDEVTMAPRMNPYTPSTTRNSRNPAKQATAPLTARVAATGTAYEAGSIARL